MVKVVVKVRMFLFDPEPQEKHLDFDMEFPPRLGEEVVDPDTGYNYEVVRVCHYPRSPRPVHLHLLRQHPAPSGGMVLQTRK